MQYRYVALASFAALAAAAPVPFGGIDWSNSPEVQDLTKRTFPFFDFWKNFLPSSMRTAFEDKSGGSGGISGASDDSDAGGDSDMAKRQAIEAEDHTKSKSHHHQEFLGGHHGPGVGHHPGDDKPGYLCADMKYWSATEGRCVGHHKPAGKGNSKGKPPAGAAVARRVDEEKAQPAHKTPGGHHPPGVVYRDVNRSTNWACLDPKYATISQGHCEGQQKGKAGNPGQVRFSGRRESELRERSFVAMEKGVLRFLRAIAVTLCNPIT